MLRRPALALTLLSLVAVASANMGGGLPSPNHPSGLTVHEWGTFTTVAGADGYAIDWLPLGGPTDLPCFVYHYQNRRDIKLLQHDEVFDYASARSKLWGKVRMETPVVYFYAPREMSVDVEVLFPRGLMTEWYPTARLTQTVVSQMTLRNPSHVSAIRWPNVEVLPGTQARFPVDIPKSHYYAARATEAATLRVGDESERFLFYRGVADFDVPLAAKALDDGGVRVTNLGSDPLAGIVLFVNRGGRIGYRVHGTLTGEATVAAPSLDGSFAQLRSELERMLVSAGLYPKEAAAMVETWRDSWFEEGTRVLYVVPPRAVDAILPLRVTPAPAAVARVFVGRMDVVTPDAQRTVANAIATNDRATLERYGRFLLPITDRILAAGVDMAMEGRTAEVNRAAFASYRARSRICE